MTISAFSITEPAPSERQLTGATLFLLAGLSVLSRAIARDLFDGEALARALVMNAGSGGAAETIGE